MTKEEIFSGIADIVSDKFAFDLNHIKPESKFKEDLSADSLDVVELVMELEKHFDIALTDEEMEKIVTVQDAVDLVASRIKY